MVQCVITSPIHILLRPSNANAYIPLDSLVGYKVLLGSMVSDCTLQSDTSVSCCRYSFFFQVPEKIFFHDAFSIILNRCQYFSILWLSISHLSYDVHQNPLHSPLPQSVHFERTKSISWSSLFLYYLKQKALNDCWSTTAITICLDCSLNVYSKQSSLLNFTWFFFFSFKTRNPSKIPFFHLIVHWNKVSIRKCK